MFLDNYLLIPISTIIFARDTYAVPTSLNTTNATAPAWIWAPDPIQCKTSTCTSDCQSAAQKLCANSNLQQTYNVTVGQCTAFYWYDTGNTIPNLTQCNLAFDQITGLPSEPGSQGDCPGYVGGALGYDKNNKRTNDPLYAVYPSTGNGNCLKAPGDLSPVLAVDELPNSNGRTLPQTCPASTSRRKRSLTQLENRDNSANENEFKCNAEALGVGTGCSGTCIFYVTTAGWEFGPFVALGWLGCSGVCMGTAVKLWLTCHKEYEQRYPKVKEKRAGPLYQTNNPCLVVQDYWTFPCQAWEQDILSVAQCPTAPAGGGVAGNGHVMVG